MRSLLLIESLDLRPSNQYILVSESPSLDTSLLLYTQLCHEANQDADITSHRVRNCISARSHDSALFLDVM
jgi:hypothetical protein